MIDWKPKKERIDILQNLPHGSLAKIARQKNISKTQVLKVLLGERKDYYEIIKEAEILAAINIWKTRFCKFNSEL
jgi:hypothetical protein